MNGAIWRLHQRYLDQQTSPVEVVAQHLAAAESLGRELNAFTAILRDSALAAAEASRDRYRAGRPRSALDGVPVSVKDLMHVQGTVTSAGSRAYPPTRQARDADIVQQLRQAGAVIFGKTNLLEFAFGLVHPDIGPAHNPWDARLTIGGSSSGAAAAVAAGIGLGAVGTDTAGSIRNPAALGGVAGYKPTWGHYSVEGVIPLSPSLDHVGWLARTTDDLVSLFAGLGGRAPVTQGRPRVAVIDLGRTAADVEELTQQAVRRIVGLVEFCDPFDYDWGLSNAAAIAIITAEAYGVHQTLLTQHWSEYSVGTRVRLLAGAGITTADYLRARQIREALRREWVKLTRDIDFVLMPTMPVVATLEELAREADLSDATLYTSTFALLGLPVVSVPLGLNVEGRPAGIQIVGRSGHDADVLAFGAQLEQLIGPLPKAPHYAELYD